MIKPHTFGELYSEIRRAGGPDQVANVLADTGPDRLRDLTRQRLATATPELRVRLLGETAAKPTHVVWMVQPNIGPTDPRIRFHDYSLHRSPIDYGAVAPCSPEVHKTMGSYIEKWHSHRYRWFVTVTLSDHGYTEERITAPQDPELTPGPISPAWYDGPAIAYWQPDTAALQKVETRTFRYGDVATMGLHDIHRLRNQCGARTFFVQGPVENEASTVFDDQLNPVWQPSDFGGSRMDGLLQRLAQSAPLLDVRPLSE